MKEITKENLELFSLGVFILFMAALVVFSCYRACNDSTKYNEMQVWCQKTACAGRELVDCNVEKSYAICKGLDGKEEVVNR